MDQLVQKEGYSEDIPDSEGLTEGLTDRELADQGVLEGLWGWRDRGGRESPTEVEFLEHSEKLTERALREQEEGMDDPSMRFVSESRQIIRRLFEEVLQMEEKRKRKWDSGE